jgi:hypothetical protein
MVYYTVPIWQVNIPMLVIGTKSDVASEQRSLPIHQKRLPLYFLKIYLLSQPVFRIRNRIRIQWPLGSGSGIQKSTKRGYLYFLYLLSQRVFRIRIRIPMAAWIRFRDPGVYEKRLPLFLFYFIYYLSQCFGSGTGSAFDGRLDPFSDPGAYKKS